MNFKSVNLNIQTISIYMTEFVGSYLLSNENGLAKYYLIFLHE